MIEPLGIALELIERRKALAARLTPAARERVFPTIYGAAAPKPGAPREHRKLPPLCEADAVEVKRPSPRVKALAVERETTIIVDVCARHWDVPPSCIYDAGRLKIWVRPRRAAIVLMQRLLKLSLPTIGYTMGRDHSTVCHAIQVHSADYETDAEYARRFDAAEAEARELLSAKTEATKQ